jgi:hypothetical protein
MAQRRDQIKRKAITSWLGRRWARTTGLFLGYGYQPWRALIFLVAVVAGTVALAVLCDTAFVHTKNSATPCTTLERVGVGLDLGLPLVKTNARTVCDFAPN